MKLSSILGLNARAEIVPSGSARGKKISRSKILTKRALLRAKVLAPEIYKIFREVRDVEEFNWENLPASFALKPSKGMGGEGIIVVRRRAKKNQGWITTSRKLVTVDDLKLHTLDILEGAYSVGDVPDVAFCEEYVGRAETFRKYAYRGTPDIRVVVYRSIPVMAMLRLPTQESGGRANLHQGAIGVGIDIATGITTHAIWYGDYIKHKPVYNPVRNPEETEEKRKLSGIKIPFWNDILLMAVQSAAAAELGYGGIDIVLHPQKGPMVLEINSQPGLQIQLANRAGLRRRIERLEDLEVPDPERGVQVAKVLFMEHFTDTHYGLHQSLRTIRSFEKIRIVGRDSKKREVRAKVDTGAWRTSIDQELAEELGLLKKKNVLWTKTFKSSLGEEKRKIIKFTYYLGGKKISTLASVADREDLKRPVIIGRRDLSGFIVMPRRALIKRPVLESKTE